MKTNTSYRNIQKTAFTLVEVLITITILALIFTSVMSVFIYYSTLWAKVEANRLLQSNIKNIIEHISKDIQSNGINISKYTISWMYGSDIGKLYVWDNEYYLVQDASFDDSWLWSAIPFNQYEDACYPVETNTEAKKCVLMKNQNGEKIILSNSWVSFKNLYFHVSEDYIPKVTINFDVWIAPWKWLQEGLIKESNIQIQTTISEKLLDQNI